MASSTFKFTSPETLDIVQRNKEIFWDKCFICQDELEGKEVLKPYRKAGNFYRPFLFLFSQIMLDLIVLGSDSEFFIYS